MLNNIKSKMKEIIAEELTTRKEGISFTLSKKTISEIKEHADKLKVPASLLVEIILRDYLNLPESKEEEHKKT